MLSQPADSKLVNPVHNCDNPGIRPTRLWIWVVQLHLLNSRLCVSPPIFELDKYALCHLDIDLAWGGRVETVMWSTDNLGNQTFQDNSTVFEEWAVEVYFGHISTLVPVACWFIQLFSARMPYLLVTTHIRLESGPCIGDHQSHHIQTLTL